MSKVNGRPVVAGRDKNLQFLLVLLSCLVAASCGQKSFPRPAQQGGPPEIKDLQSQVRPRGAVLNWSAPDQLLTKTKGVVYQLVIQRAELRWENRNCLDCPAQYQDKQVIDIIRPQPAVRDGKKFSWIDATVARDHAYRYQIGIRDDKGRIVSVSNPAVVKILPVPAAPTQISADPEGQGILVRWQKPQKDKSGTTMQGQLKFVVERSTSSKSPKWDAISPVPVDGTEFLDTTVASDQNYEYRVVPFMVFEETNILGEPSPVQPAKAPDTVTPPPPQSVWVLPGKGHLEIHWLESEGKVMGYHVYRRQGQEIIRLTVNPLNHPPFVDQRAAKNEIYFYAVSAVGPGPQYREGLLSKWVEIRNTFFQ
jgi:hypothetical protein